MATLIKFNIGGSDSWLRAILQGEPRLDVKVARVVVEDSEWRDTAHRMVLHLTNKRIPYGGYEAVNVLYATKERDGYGD